MILGIQLLGLLFAFMMLYLTYLYYKREQYELRGLIVWSLIWIGFGILVMFPASVYGVMEVLNIQRTVDFFVIGGFLVFSTILFYLYIITKETQRKVESLVRQIAIEKKKK
ncbi:DUF2304 domain-containing protein [Candidatus Woesearchaeota archaeon]|nr:DUF2304 domain-containing protein [Candidatus Woesearchaeota archaeon]